MYKLYFALKSASMGIQLLMEELGTPYELIPMDIDRSVPRPPAHQAINPNGWIPVLTWDGGAMYEAAAIAIYLCDRHPEAGLAPAHDDPMRGRYLQTLVYFSNSIQNAYQLTYYPDRFVDDPAVEPRAQARGVRRLQETFQVIEDQIADQNWILGDRMSAADIYLFMLCTWRRNAKAHPSLDYFPNIMRIVQKVMDRPSTQKVYAPWIENPEY